MKLSNIRSVFMVKKVSIFLFLMAGILRLSAGDVAGLAEELLKKYPPTQSRIKTTMAGFIAVVN